jgi:hypothetical protein
VGGKGAAQGAIEGVVEIHGAVRRGRFKFVYWRTPQARQLVEFIEAYGRRFPWRRFLRVFGFARAGGYSLMKLHYLLHCDCHHVPRSPLIRWTIVIGLLSLGLLVTVAARAAEAPVAIAAR